MNSLGDNREEIAGLSEILNQMWAKFLPQIRDRANVLEEAAQAAMAGTLSEEERQAAQSAAHKLAGTLGTFGLDRGTELARELEAVFADGVERESPERIGVAAAEIRAIIEGRKTGA